MPWGALLTKFGPALLRWGLTVLGAGQLVEWLTDGAREPAPPAATPQLAAQLHELLSTPGAAFSDAPEVDGPEDIFERTETALDEALSAETYVPDQRVEIVHVLRRWPAP